MPEADALQAAEQFRRRLLRAERAAAVRLVNAYGDAYVRLQKQINALIAELDAMQAAGEEPKAWKVKQLPRLKQLQKDIATEMTRYAAIVEAEVKEGARAAIAQAQRDAQALTQAALPGVQAIDIKIMESWQRLNPAAVETMLGFLSEDSPLVKGMREKFGPEVAKGVTDALVQGIAMGYNPRKVAAQFSKDMGVALISSLRTARTAQLYAYREASRASYLANPEIVKGWVWRAARNGRTCMACIAMDGKEFPPSARLNDHWNGRCAAVPKTVTYRELGLDVDEPESVLPEPASEWFAKLPEAEQRSMMGPGKYEAWKSGKLKLDDLVQEKPDRVWGLMRSEAPLKDVA